MGDIYGWLSIAMFAAAWYLNKRLNGWSWSAWVVLPLALMGSMLLYASGWGLALSGLMSGALGWLGGLVGAPLPVAMVMGIIAALALIATVVDLFKDHTYNRAAVLALIIAPVAAHGSTGAVGTIVHAIHGGGADLSVAAVSALFGG